MIDIKFLRENPDIVKDNIRKKFQEEKLALVDEVIALDAENRRAKQEGDDLRASRNKISKEIGKLMGQGKKEEAEAMKAEVAAGAKRLAELEVQEAQLQEKITGIMMKIPNIIDPSVPIGRDDSENVEIQKYGEPTVPEFEVPYHADILDSISGLDKDAAGRVGGNGFYYLMGDAARIHSSMLSYARDFMIDKGFTYCIPPFMIRGNVVDGVMSFTEREAMMYKIEGEDLYLIGTSEHSMIGRFKGQIVNEATLPITMTSYSPCFRKEVGSHGIEERGVYRVHQFEKQEMIVLCKPEDSMDWYNKMWYCPKRYPISRPPTPISPAGTSVFGPIWRYSSVIKDWQKRMTSASLFPLGSKSLPPLPPPIGRVVREFLNICSKPKNLMIERFTLG